MSDKTTLTKAANEARVIAEKFKHLNEMLGNPKKLTRFQQVSFFDLVDALNEIAYTLNSRTDGRPQPLDLSEAYRPSKEMRATHPTSVIEEFEELADMNSRWAECDEPAVSDHSEVAHVGGRGFTSEELIKLRDWINAVLDWHGGRK